MKITNIITGTNVWTMVAKDSTSTSEPAPYAQHYAAIFACLPEILVKKVIKIFFIIWNPYSVQLD